MYKITMEQRLWYQFLLELLLLKSYFFWLLSHFFIKCAARDRGSWGNTSTVSANTANHAFQIMAIKRSYLSLTFLFKVCSVHYSFVACYHLLSSPSSSSTITIIIIIITIIIIIIIIIIIYYYYTSDSLSKIWLVESIQSIHNSLWTWHDKCNICCRYCIYHVKFNVCLVTKPLGVFSFSFLLVH